MTRVDIHQSMHRKNGSRFVGVESDVQPQAIGDSGYPDAKNEIEPAEDLLDRTNALRHRLSNAVLDKMR